MRFDEASAKFAEFGPFYTGLQFAPAHLGAFLGGAVPQLS
jgi:chlorite dismutase